MADKPKRATGRIITPAGVLSFPALAKPVKNDAGQEKYEAQIVFAPGTDITEIEEIVQEALDTLVPDDIDKDELRLPIKQSKAKAKKLGAPYVEGGTYVTAKSNYQPGMVDGDLDAIIAVDDELYPGAVVKLQVHAYFYNAKGNKGIGIGLDNVQKVKDGDKLASGGPDAAEAFEKVTADDLM